MVAGIQDLLAGICVSSYTSKFDSSNLLLFLSKRIITSRWAKCEVQALKACNDRRKK
ncbi:hypothetical protein ACET3Z_029676 [Daucus carota]